MQRHSRTSHRHETDGSKGQNIIRRSSRQRSFYPARDVGYERRERTAVQYASSAVSGKARLQVRFNFPNFHFFIIFFQHDDK